MNEKEHTPAQRTHSWICDLDLLQQPLDLCFAQTALSIGEDAAGGFKVLRAKQWNTCQEFFLARL